MSGSTHIPRQWREHLDAEECVHGDETCNGLEDILAGRLPCLECLQDAPAEAVAKMNAKRLARQANVPTVERGVEP